MQGKCTAIINQTTESFNYYKNKLEYSTVLERFFTSHHRLTLEEQRESKALRLRNFHLKDRIRRIRPRRIRNLNKYKGIVKEYAMDYSALALRSYNGCRDIIIAMLKSHAILNDRNRLVLDDISFVRMMRDYLIDPFAPNDHRIIECLRQGRSYKDICLLLNRKPSYKAYISKVARRAKERGVIDFE